MMFSIYSSQFIAHANLNWPYNMSSFEATHYVHNLIFYKNYMYMFESTTHNILNQTRNMSSFRSTYYAHDLNLSLNIYLI